MDIEFTFTRDKQYWRRLLRDQARPYLVYKLLLPGSLVISVLCFVSGNGLAVFAGLVSLIVARGCWQVFSSPLQRAVDYLPPYAFQPRTYMLSEDSVTASTPLMSIHLKWDAIKRVPEFPYAYLVYYDKDRYLDVPRAGLTTEQGEQLRQFLIDRDLLRSSSGQPLPVTTTPSD